MFWFPTSDTTALSSISTVVLNRYFRRHDIWRQTSMCYVNVYAVCNSSLLPSYPTTSEESVCICMYMCMYICMYHMDKWFAWGCTSSKSIIHMIYIYIYSYSRIILFIYIEFIFICVYMGFLHSLMMSQRWIASSCLSRELGLKANNKSYHVSKGINRIIWIYDLIPNYRCHWLTVNVKGCAK